MVFGKFFKKFTSSIAKFENEDMLKAVIGGSTMVIFADGDAEDSEYESLKGIIQSHEKLSHFGSEIQEHISNYQRLFKSGTTTATVKVLQEMAEFDFSSEEKNEIFAVMIDVSKADGEMEPQEIQVLQQIGSRLNVDLDMFGL